MLLPDTNELFEKWRNAPPGEQERAERQLFASLRRFAAAVVWKRLHENDGVLIDTIVEEVFRNAPTFRGECLFTTWVYEVANRQVNASLRGRIRRRRIIDPNITVAETEDREETQSVWPAEDKAGDLFSRIALNEIAKVLSPKERRLFEELRQGKSPKDLAAELGVTPNALESRSRRLMKKLQKIFATRRRETD